VKKKNMYVIDGIAFVGIFFSVLDICWTVSANTLCSLMLLNLGHKALYLM
jgi:hypothetical protein